METKICQEEIDVIKDLCNRCYFLSKKERTRFFAEVLASVGRTNLADITEDEFETAFNVGKEILYKTGEAVFKPQANSGRFIFYQNNRRFRRSA